MRTLRLFYTFLAIVALHGNATPQNTIFLYTKFATQLNFIDAFNKVIPKSAIWKQEDGGYSLNFDDLENTFIVANASNANFKLSNNAKLTKLIALQANEKTSLEKCFTSQKYCCEQLNDKQKKGTEKILAVAVMKKSHRAMDPITFSKSNKPEITRLDDLAVSWIATDSIKEIYIVDVNDIDVIWQQIKYNQDKLTYNDIKASLKKGLEKNHKYQVNILTNKSDERKYVYDFLYKDLAFDSQDYHFASQDAVTFDWSTDKKITRIGLKNVQSGQVEWESSNYTMSRLDYSTIYASNKKDLIPGNTYRVEIELDTKEVFNYTFEILLGKEDSEALKAIIE